MPINALLIRALLNLTTSTATSSRLSPSGSGHYMTLFEVARELSRRLASTFLRPSSSVLGQAGRRPVYGGTATFQDDPHWRDLILLL